MAVFYNGVRAFIESVGRRTTNDKRNTLDRISTIWTGPSSGALAFKPANGTPHPEFPLMYCEKSNILAMAGLVAEIRIDYIGKIEGSPSGVYRTVPDINTARHWGQLSWTVYDHFAVNQTAAGAQQIIQELSSPAVPAVPPTYNSDGTISTPGVDAIPAVYVPTYGPGGTAPVVSVYFVSYAWSARYLAKAVTFKYLTNQRPLPGFGGNFSGQAEPYLGTESLQQWRTGITTSTDGNGIVTSTPTFENDLVDLQVTDLDNGWFEVSEVYQTVGFVTSSILTEVGR